VTRRLLWGEDTSLDYFSARDVHHGRRLGQGNQLGTIAQGKSADAVVLEGDPLLDIANVKRIAAVIAAGRLLRQADLERLKTPPKP
jgi:cytosine/adenosine deaminase-related metal-dependent hydrolase